MVSVVTRIFTFDREHRQAERCRRYAYKQMKHTLNREAWNRAAWPNDRNEIQSQYFALCGAEWGPPDNVR